MKGQQKVAETEEGTVQIQEGAVATGEDPTSVAIASIQSAATFSDPNIKYVFRTENGGTQVMYRVIQVAEGQLDGQTEGTGAISGYPAAQSMTQAVIQGAFTSEDAVETEATATETHYTYFPTTALADTSTSTGAGTTATAVVTTQNSEALLGQATPTGQFFVMMSPQEVLQGGAQRSIAPRNHPYSPKSEAPRTTRDEKRRAQHNEDGKAQLSGSAVVISPRNPRLRSLNLKATQAFDNLEVHSGAPTQGQDQQLDCATLQDHPRLLHGEHQVGAEQGRDPLQSLRLHPGAAAEQPPPVRGAAGPRPAADGQRRLAAAGGRSQEQELDPAGAAASARGGDHHQERRPLTGQGCGGSGRTPGLRGCRGSR